MATTDVTPHTFHLPFRWKLVDTGGGSYRLVNVRNGWWADVASGSAADGARVIQWPVGTGTNQQWQLVAL